MSKKIKPHILGYTPPVATLENYERAGKGIVEHCRKKVAGRR